MNNSLIQPENTLIVVALEDELPTQLVAGWNVLYTGVGKVNAAIAATEAVLETRPIHLINYGTAGALNPSITGLNRVNHIVQRDMDVRPLGFELGHTPFDTTGHIDLGGPGVSLGTGDHFVTTPPELVTDIVDMEAYALAKVARLFSIHFQCWKYISDNANEDAADHWAENVAKGARAFVDEVIQPLTR
ncbi:MAG: 5'-methylthioadenosine nucleosidase [Gammaproteobacteria bacterium]|jgi:adenosylhomocysteine nucleosidase|nr:5'-methylthioadenosine nucleosidase [Gammaproteobacteria bacterium]